jgi:DNA-directed RNA polymerase subunit RPC12/RpoP
MAATIANALAQAPFKCLRCNRVFRARALRALVQLRCRGCGRRDFAPITEAEVEVLARS